MIIESTQLKNQRRSSICITINMKHFTRIQHQSKMERVSLPNKYDAKRRNVSHSKVKYDAIQRSVSHSKVKYDAIQRSMSHSKVNMMGSNFIKNKRKHT